MKGATQWKLGAIEWMQGTSTDSKQQLKGCKKQLKEIRSN
jgi:hypothetical protein